MAVEPLTVDDDAVAAGAVDAVDGGSEQRTPPKGRRDDVQGLRALAVVLVVLYHADRVLSGGYIGVDVFFVISGFVIMAMMLRELDGTGSLDMGRFYSRRIKRLLPALAVMLTATAALSALILSPFGAQQTAADTGQAASLFGANARLYLSPTGYFDAAADLNPLLHTWSLAVEEQFYLLFPFALFLAWRIGRRSPRKAALVVLLAAGLVSFASSVLLVDAGEQQSLLSQPRQFAFYASPTRAWEFVAGALLAFTVGWAERLPRLVGHVMAAVGLVVILWCSFVYTDLTPFPGSAAIPPVLATVLLIIAGSATGDGIIAALGSRIPVRLGDLSYSWYLWHWPAIVFVTVLAPGRGLAVAAGFASIVLAWLSYVLVEEPFRHSERWQGWSSAGLALACIAIPIVAMAGVRAGADNLWGDDTLEQVAPYTALHGDVVRGCDITQGVPWELERCTWQADDATTATATSTATPTSTAPAGQQILLIGDSHAGHLTEAVAGAGNQLGLDVVIRTSSNCPVVQTTIVNLDGTPTAACRSLVDEAVEQAVTTRPGLVIISTAVREYLESDMLVLGDDRDRFERSRSDKLDIWRQGFEPLLETLTDAGVPVLVMQPLPVFEDWSLVSCSLLTMATSPANCGAEAPQAELMEDRAPYAALNQEMVDRFPLADTADLFESLCPDATCVTNDADTYHYRDGDHITVDRSQQLADDLVPLLQDQLAAPS